MSGEQRHVYFEHHVIGGTVKVVAIDSLTAIEVSIMGPATTPKGDLERLALRKLIARINRERGG
jgi:hypothetical protein